MNDKNIIEENKKLKRKLGNIELWIKRQLKEQLSIIRKTKILKNAKNIKEDFVIDSAESIIEKQIMEFFSDILWVNIPSWTINNIVNSEINYYNLKKWQNIDGFSIIIWYNKVIDSLIENFITKEFRQFVNKNYKNIVVLNTPIEKSLKLVINKWYSLSTWRLYNVIVNINWANVLDWYTKIFSDFLESYKYLKDILLEEVFLFKLWELVNSEVLWKKRHSWVINNEETEKMRNILIWDFKDKTCIIYRLLETQNLPI